MLSPGQDLIEQVIARCRVPGERRRREIIRELSDHLEDSTDAIRAAGHDADATERMVELRFDDVDALGRAFAVVYGAERHVRFAASVVALLATALVGATLTIVGFQSLIAIWTAHPLRASFTHATPELVGIAAVALGYCCPSFAARLGVRPAWQMLGSTAAVAIGIGAYWLATPPGFAPMPIVAFACAASARLLQRVDTPLLWLAGTARPLLIAWSVFGPLIQIDAPGAQFFPWPVWCGITGACLLLRPIVRLFEGT
jgi:hypothetical protein